MMKLKKLNHGDTESRRSYFSPCLRDSVVQADTTKQALRVSQSPSSFMFPSCA